MIEFTKKHDEFQNVKSKQDKRTTHQHHSKKKMERTEEKIEREQLWDSDM